jgi:hypothetical protein
LKFGQKGYFVIEMFWRIASRLITYAHVKKTASVAPAIFLEEENVLTSRELAKNVRSAAQALVVNTT